MSAKEMTIFFPRTFDVEAIVPRLVSELGLEMQEIPAGKNFSFQASAMRGTGKSLLLMEYRKNAQNLIHELSEWEKPSRTYIRLLLDCESSITFYYRNIEDARSALFAIGSLHNTVANACVFDNDMGCLLILSSILGNLQSDANWSWERTAFPDLPDVAASEWEDDA